MEQDLARLHKLRDELLALRALCKSPFVIRSIDEVMRDIGERLDLLGDIELPAALAAARAHKEVPSVR